MPEGATSPPPLLYFCESKLQVWTNISDKASEACRVTTQLVGKFFDRLRRDVVSQIVGKLICYIYEPNVATCFSFISWFRLLKSIYTLN